MTGTERRTIALLGLMVGLGAGCGGTGSSPTVATAPSVVAAPPPSPSPTPTPTPTPIPAPTPTPCTQGLCEPPTTNTSPPARLTLRLYAVEDGQGRFIEDFPAHQAIPVGYTARIDATAKDEDGGETLGSGNVEFSFSDPGMVRVRSGHPFQRRLTALRPGTIECQASLDGVLSNVITLTFQ